MSQTQHCETCPNKRANLYRNPYHGKYQCNECLAKNTDFTLLDALTTIETVNCGDCWSGTGIACVPIGGQDIQPINELPRMYHLSRKKRAEQKLGI